LGWVGGRRQLQALGVRMMVRQYLIGGFAENGVQIRNPLPVQSKKLLYLFTQPVRKPVYRDNSHALFTFFYQGVFTWTMAVAVANYRLLLS
jgi:hypothetical protein